MFGHHDDDRPAEADEHHETAAVADDQPAGPPPTDDTPASSFNDDPGPSPSPAPASTSSDWQNPGTPLPDNKGSVNDVISPAGGFPKKPTYQYPPGVTPKNDELPQTDSNADPELIDIRDHALEELEPLLDHLDLPPEDKFRLIMMILQHKDDESLVKKAYEAAHAIEDDDIRGRALYDIVNEVNYFTQPPDPSQEG